MNAIEQLIARPAWMKDAACLEHPAGWWFTDKGGSGRRAREVCGQCLVRRECLVYGLEHRERFGIWGGFNMKDIARWRRIRCDRCHLTIPSEHLAALIIRNADRSSWFCRRCWYRSIQERKRT